MARKATGAPGHISRRLGEFRRRMRKGRLDALLIKNEADCYYLTGFTGSESAVMITPRSVHILTDGRFLTEMAREVPWARHWVRKGGLNEEIVKACEELKIRRLGVQPESFTLGDQSDLTTKAPRLRLVPAPPITVQMRRFKDDVELEAMRRAMRVAEEGFRAAVEALQPGQTELDVAARVEFEMKRRGASGPAFNTICAEGANAALPHAVPGKRKIKKGSAVLIDWGARVGGYNSDLTRVVFVGSIPPKIAEIYRITLDAQEAAIDAIRPGRRMNEVDAVARTLITSAGYGNQFTHGLGHGLGLEVHEAPALSWRSKEELAPGMVVTVEPGIYLPGLGGVRIEDDVLVTKTGHRVLTRLDKSIAGARVF